MIFSESELMHIGTPQRFAGDPHGSGRYREGSGENPYQHDGFRRSVADLRKQGMSDTEIARAFDMTTTEFRKKITLDREAKKAADYSRALKLRDKGYSYTEIANKLGYNSSNSIKNLLNPAFKERNEITSNIADVLKNAVNEKKYIDVGPGTELYLGISRQKLSTVIRKLKDEGYDVRKIKVKQLGTGKDTTVSVLVKDDVPWAEVVKNKDQIQLINGRFEDDGRSYLNLEPPVSIDSKRIQVNYSDTGTGGDKDGVIELRRGVSDISLGNANYAQVRIAVDGTHYLKGMAMYADDLPDGVDIRFNTNKTSDVPMLGSKDNSVLKPLKNNPENPFGATIKPEEKLVLAQRYYVDENGNRKLSPINVVNEEGDWNEWSRSLSSQFLSKQPVELAKRQLNLDVSRKEFELNDILEYNNPVVRRRLLESLADDCDSRAVHLKAAGLPRQASKVILPVTSMKENEIYAPRYFDGEDVVLIRYPHGGKFEIPRLTVNNHNKSARSLIGDAPDAVGIHPEVAKKLSGADFDGDTVLVIPVNKNVDIKTVPSLSGLKNFDPQTYYKAYPGMPETSKKNGFNKQLEMGKVSNLITDMTIKGANYDEIARAVRHSMVVIDAEKHNLNWRQSEIDNDIKALKVKYQGGANKGASTIISRASAEDHPLEKKEITSLKYMTPQQQKDYISGKKILVKTGRSYEDVKWDKEALKWVRTGKIKEARYTSTKMAETDDPYSLMSDRYAPKAIEKVYADYANKMKSLANEARKEARATKDIPYSPSAHTVYKNEVDSLREKLDKAVSNKPLERQAQLIANKTVQTQLRANPEIRNEKDDLKKLKVQALDAARHKVGKKPYSIYISDKEWEAIQAGSISKTQLSQIIESADLDRVKQLATPKKKKGISQSKLNRAKAMSKRGYTQAEIADVLNVSISTLQEGLSNS